MTLEEWKVDYDDRHYIMVIKYNNKIIVSEDLASFQRTWMIEEGFLIRWHDTDPRTREKFEHFAMVPPGKQPASKLSKYLD